MAFQDHLLGYKNYAFKTRQKQVHESCGKETEEVCRQMGRYNPRSLCVWHSTGAPVTFSHKFPLEKTTHKCEAKSQRLRKVQWTQRSADCPHMALQMLVQGTRGSSHALYDYQAGWRKPLHYEPEANKTSTQLVKSSNNHNEADQGGHLSATMCSLTQHQVSILPDSCGRGHCHFLHLRWRGKIYQFKTLPFGPLTAHKTFSRVMNSSLLQCWKMGIILFCNLDSALIMNNS